MTAMCKDFEMLACKAIQKTFRYLDYDKNGWITGKDLVEVLCPTTITSEQIVDVFEEVSLFLKEDVKMTGININQFRKMIMLQSIDKRQRLVDYMQKNKSMRLIKECREIVTL